jgi:hypothetical protein
MILRNLVFDGPGKPSARIDFDEGLNVVYGASDRGKSFILSALDFMFGKNISREKRRKAPLKEIRELEGYVSAYLSLTLPAGDRTLFRAVRQGGFKVYKGLYTQSAPEALIEEVDRPDEVILSALGLYGKSVAKNKKGETKSVTLRTLAPYILVDEDTIISDTSPILSGQYADRPYETNQFRFLLTGIDDRNIVPLSAKKQSQPKLEGKIELLDDMIQEMSKRVGASAEGRGRIAERLSAHENRIERFEQEIARALDEQSSLADEKMAALTKRAELRAGLEQTATTLREFDRLLKIYRSDLRRIEGLEEGSFLLAARSKRACAVCGAIHEHQQHDRIAMETGSLVEAAAAEMQKIKRDMRDLETLVAALSEQETRESASLLAAEEAISSLTSRQNALRPVIASARDAAAQASSLVDRDRDFLISLDKLDDYRAIHARLVAQRAQSGAVGKQGAVSQGAASSVTYEFAKTVQDVLSRWQFDANVDVSFSDERQDIMVSGKHRDAHGKGVKAILHSAFKVALLIYCQKRNLPHPGLLVLDTPLLTYRSATFKSERYGPLQDDEERVKATSLDEHFYEHLMELQDQAQFIVLENKTPPRAVIDAANVVSFSVEEGGRIGFFPTNVT